VNFRTRSTMESILGRFGTVGRSSPPSFNEEYNTSYVNFNFSSPENLARAAREAPLGPWTYLKRNVPDISTARSMVLVRV
jgi:hypothetical protein